MNLPLLDPSFNNLPPDAIKESLEHGFARVCAFNRKATLLAAACVSSGSVVIWDFETRGVARVLPGHRKAVNSLSWSRSGRKLLTASDDCKVHKWDVSEPRLERVVLFETKVKSAALHPKDTSLFVCCPHAETATVVRLQPTDDDAANDERFALAVPDGGDNEKIVSAIFSKDGSQIITGSSRGTVTVFDTATLQPRVSYTIAKCRIQQLVLSRDGLFVLANCMDRTLRVVDLDTSAVIGSFQDVVNRTAWSSCCFSGNGDYVLAADADPSKHSIYIWSRAFGALQKILQGPKEGCYCVAYHPTRPILTACSGKGSIYVWDKTPPQAGNANWSAFAPGFQQLENNKEYIERESEFDIKAGGAAGDGEQDQFDGDVDIETLCRSSEFSSDEEDELDGLAAAPSVDRDVRAIWLANQRAEQQPAAGDAGQEGEVDASNAMQVA